MRKYLVGFWYSMPVQLLFLHFRRYQVFLLFWGILFATLSGRFMNTFGAYSLFLAPEYFGEVTALSTAIVGFATGIFVMSWNIATFILYRRYISFLATTAQPFLKYTINNGILPAIYLLFYCFSAIRYNAAQEFAGTLEIILLILGFAGGFFLAVLLAFAYFFGADKTIYQSMAHVIDTANLHYALAQKDNPLPEHKHEIRIDWFLSALFRLRKPRDIRHYSAEFITTIFQRHNASAVIAIILAFIFLIVVGFSSDAALFQLPAAASITILFALLVAMAAAFSALLGNWSIPVIIFLYACINWMYQNEIIDPRNKAYGLNYLNKTERPAYTKESIRAMISDTALENDKQNYLSILNKWKAKQETEKPIFYIINVSGGGTRSAGFTMNVLQYADSLMGGSLMKQTGLITGASGGMLSAAYFREMYLQKIKGNAVHLQDKQYFEDITKDLLNPLFSSFVSRDLLGPAQRFSVHGMNYVKDRAYAFEDKLNDNTRGWLDKSIADYVQPENEAIIPLLFFNSVITRDGRKMILGTQPARFLMHTKLPDSSIMPADADAIDFQTLFKQQGPGNVRVLTALRMNATFPYVLPNVWLPSNPVIDVMDAGLRDNYGMETSLRFIHTFKDWLQENCSKVVLLQIRDRSISDWDKPYDSKDLFGLFTKPFLLLQNNWYKMQDYYQTDQLNYLYDQMGGSFERVCFQYIPAKKEAPAALSFHSTTAEKKDIAASLFNESNLEAARRLKKLIR